MNVDLSNSEIELIEKALKAWVEQPSADGTVNSMFGTILGSISGKQGREEMLAEVKVEQAKAGEEVRRRERASVLLRAKLMQAQARASEHEIETPQAP
jgi:hypothetical protein